MNVIMFSRWSLRIWALFCPWGLFMLPASAKCTFKYGVQGVKNEDIHSFGKKKKFSLWNKAYCIYWSLLTRGAKTVRKAIAKWLNFVDVKLFSAAAEWCRKMHQKSMKRGIFPRSGLHVLSPLTSYSGLQHTKHRAILFFLSLPNFLFASTLFFFSLFEGLLDQSRSLTCLAFQL